MSMIIEYDGEQYEIRYTFSTIRKLRALDVDVPGTFRAIQEAPERAPDFADVYAAAVCHLMQAAGAPVTEPEVWESVKTDPAFSAECGRVFMWLVTEHYASSANAPKPKKKKAARKTST